MADIIDVKIIGAEAPSYWYAESIGEIFSVTLSGSSYIVESDRLAAIGHDESVVRMISASDCIEVVQPNLSASDSESTL